MKKTSIFLTLLLAATFAFAQTGELRLINFTNGSLIVGSSSNARYFVGYGNESAAIYDYQTNTVKESNAEMDVVAYDLRDASNTGIGAGAKGATPGDLFPATLNFETNAWTMLALPAGNAFYGCAFGINPDATLIVGYYAPGGGVSLPLLWVNNVPQVLPIPTIDIFEFTEYLGGIAHSISDDGNTIFGRFIDYMGNEYPMCWKKNGETWEFDVLGEEILFDLTQNPLDEEGNPNWDFFTNFGLDFSGSMVSGNGKYVMGTRSEFTGDPWDLERVPILLNLEDKTFTLVSTLDDAIGLNASNWGVCMVATPYFEMVRSSFVCLSPTSTQVALEDMATICGINLLENLPSSGTSAITDDGSKVYGFTYGEGVKNFILTNCGLKVEETSKTKITIYPNPTNGELRIKSEELRVNLVEIFDIAGKKLSTINYPLPSINISDLKAGIYFVKITTEQGVVMQKVVKN